VKKKTLRRAEKSAATRERLLEATFECLHELGYSGTTTLEVCDRAGASRGALLHHFPTRAQLVAETAEYVMFRGLKEYKESVKSLPADERNTDRLIDLLWQYASGKTSLVWIELVVAARTDKSLQREVDRVRLRFRQGILETYEDLVPTLEGLPEGFRGAALELATFLVNGLALYKTFRPESELQVPLEALKVYYRLLRHDRVRALVQAPEDAVDAQDELHHAAQAIESLGRALRQPEVKDLVKRLLAETT
jgi:AcrR family transcriptional regulator